MIKTCLNSTYSDEIVFISALTKLEPRAGARPRHFHAPPTSVRAVCAGSERTAREPALRRAKRRGPSCGET